MLSNIGKWYSVVFLYKGSLSLTYIARLMLIVMMVVNVVMVVIRKVLVTFGWATGGGIVGGYEITQMSLLILTGTACAYTWYSAGHIRIGLFRDNMKERRRALLDAFVALAGTVYVGLTSWALFKQALGYAAYSIRTPLLKMPIAPWAFLFSIIMAFVFLVLMRSCIGLFSKAMGKKFAAEPYLKSESSEG
ncbi:MAG: TRAP transporter small permease subunit [Chloroflexota bacterium]